MNLGFKGFKGIKMTEQELRKFNKEIEDEAIRIIGELKWYQVNKKPNKAGVLVEDIIPILVSFIKDIRLK